MFKRINWFVSLGIAFLLSSVLLYMLHYIIFRDSTFIFRYLIAQLAFLPLNVYLVTVVLNSLLSKRDKAIRLKKMNMVIGAYFSDIGTDLLRLIIRFDPNTPQIMQEYQLSEMDMDEYFQSILRCLNDSNYELQLDKSSFADLHAYLSQKHDHLLRLLENTNLFEHQSFSRLLWATFHVLDELDAREDFMAFSEADCRHLAEDVKRVYRLLVTQWISYMQHLSKHYPHLHSFAIRTNPFTPWVPVEIH